MARFLKSEELSAQLAAVDSLLEHSDGDPLGRIGLNSRRVELATELAALKVGNDTLASTALYFGGNPVIGASAIRADFAAAMIYDFRDLVVKTWATMDTQELGARGPIHDQDQVELHITALLHGSMGFLIEEIDAKGPPLFDSPTKTAADQVTALLEAIGAVEEEIYLQKIEHLQPRVFQSALHFFSTLHRAEASLRLVDDQREVYLDRASVDRGFVRLEETKVDEVEVKVLGQLIGIIPYGAKFEFQTSDGSLIKGKVAPTMSEAFLQRLHDEQAIGKRFTATIKRRTVSRLGYPTETYTLTELTEIRPDEDPA